MQTVTQPLALPVIHSIVEGTHEFLFIARPLDLQTVSAVMEIDYP